LDSDNKVLYNVNLLSDPPIEAISIKICPFGGYGRKAMNFQIEVLGNYIDLGVPLGMADGRINDYQIITASSLGTGKASLPPAQVFNPVAHKFKLTSCALFGAISVSFRGKTSF
jgi:hypothetical protein